MTYGEFSSNIFRELQSNPVTKDEMKRIFDERYERMCEKKKETISKVVFIKYPTVILENGGECLISEIEGSVQVGVVIDTEAKKVVGNEINVDCPGGVCPIV